MPSKKEDVTGNYGGYSNFDALQKRHAEKAEAESGRNADKKLAPPAERSSSKPTASPRSALAPPSARDKAIKRGSGSRTRSSSSQRRQLEKASSRTSTSGRERSSRSSSRRSESKGAEQLSCVRSESKGPGRRSESKGPRRSESRGPSMGPARSKSKTDASKPGTPPSHGMEGQGGVMLPMAKLEMTVICAKNLPKISYKPKSYCVVSCSTISKKTDADLDNGTNPVWGKRFEFQVGAALRECGNVTMSVFEQSNVGEDTLIAVAKLPISELQDEEREVTMPLMKSDTAGKSDMTITVCASITGGIPKATSSTASGPDAKASTASLSTMASSTEKKESSGSLDAIDDDPASWRYYTSNGWAPMDEESAKIIERHYIGAHSDLTDMIVYTDFRGVPYCLNFLKQEMINQSTGKARRLQRVVAQSI